MKVSATAARLPYSGIREVMDLAAHLDGDLIRLELGESDFPTPEHVLDAASRAAAAGRTRYAPNAGIPELRSAFAERVRGRYGRATDSDQVVVTCGATQGMFMCLLALTEPGDEILIPDPGWPNYALMARLLRAEPVYYPLAHDDAFQPRAEDLEQRIGPRTKVLVLNSPSNPVGAVITGPRLTEILRVAAEHGLWVISDECYDDLVFDVPYASTAGLDATGLTVSVYSLSKSYSMTGWRVGCVVGPRVLAETITKLQEPVLSSVNTPAQWGAVAALTGSPCHIETMKRAYASRRDQALALCAAAGLPAVPPSGAFYLWVDVRAANLSSREFASELVRQARVTVAPGSAFGPSGEGYVRVSLVAESSRLLEGLGRMANLWARRAATC